MKYCLYTLVDITYTGQYRNDPDKKIEKNQQQNFDTVIQTLELRSNIFYDRKPELIQDSANKYGFDSSSEQKIWSFTWETEQMDLYLKEANQVGHLIEDFQFVPFIPNLKETVIINRPIFISQGPHTNIIFQVKQ